MRLLFLNIIFFSYLATVHLAEAQVLDQSDIDCDSKIQTSVSPELQIFVDQMARIVRPAVSVLKIEGPVFCRAPVPTREQMLDWLFRLDPSSKKVSKKIHGVQFIDQPAELLALFEKMTTVRKPEYALEQKTFVLDSNCHEFTCAVEQIFGKRAGIAHAYLAKRYGFFPAQYSGTLEWPPSKFRNFSEAEFRDVMASMVEIPSKHEPLVRDEFIARVNGVKPTRIWNWGDSTIQLFDPWGAQNSQNREPTIFHEWVHLMAEKLNLDNSPEWLRISTPNSGFVSGYAQREGPGEDFAESVSAYRYNAAKLKKISPEKYAYIQKMVFDGQEFLNKESCR